MKFEKSGSLEKLPGERLKPILDHLCQSDLGAATRLLRCSQHLRRCIEPMLYTRKEIQTRAMRLACNKGHTKTSRLRVSYGAPISTYIRESRCQIGDPLILFTLCPAAKHRRVEAFRVLLELGARIDLLQGLQRPVQMAQLRQLVKNVFSRSSIRAAPDLARLFFESGLHIQLKKAGQVPDIYHPFIRLIKAGAPTELIQLLLDQGANPNCVQANYPSEELVSALSAAVVAKSPTTFRLLIANGANISDPELSNPKSTTKALHIPVFAAAHATAIAPTAQSYDDAKAMMRICLEYGADIKQSANMVGTPVLFLTRQTAGLMTVGEESGSAATCTTRPTLCTYFLTQAPRGRQC